MHVCKIKSSLDLNKLFIKCILETHGGVTYRRENAIIIANMNLCFQICVSIKKPSIGKCRYIYRVLFYFNILYC